MYIKNHSIFNYLFMEYLTCRLNLLAYFDPYKARFKKHMSNF